MFRRCPVRAQGCNNPTHIMVVHHALRWSCPANQLSAASVQACSEEKRVCDATKVQGATCSRKRSGRLNISLCGGRARFTCWLLCACAGKSEATCAAQSKRSEQRGNQSCVWGYGLSATDQASLTVNNMGCPIMLQKQPAEQGAAASEVTRRWNRRVLYMSVRHCST